MAPGKAVQPYLASVFSSLPLFASVTATPEVTPRAPRFYATLTHCLIYRSF